MKKLSLIAAALSLGLCTLAYAYMQPTWGKPIANESALAYNNTYSFQTNNSRVDSLSFQCVYTSATLPTTTFNDSSITLNSAVISATNTYTSLDPAQTGAIGFPVLYSSSTLTVAPLVNQTTYYVIPVDRNSFKLALTSTGAVAGLGIVITSSNTAKTYSLAPIAITGTPSFKWQASNDGVNFNDFTANSYNVAVSSVTMLSYTLGGTSTIWDFGPYDYTWIRLNVVAPTKGGIRLICTPNGEGQSANY